MSSVLSRIVKVLNSKLASLLAGAKCRPSVVHARSFASARPTPNAKL